MSSNLLARYIWIVDTIRRHGRISRSELDAKWRRSQFSDNGEGLPRRTFYNYRQAIEELFNVSLTFDKADQEELKAYVKDYGKEALIDVIIQKAKGEI